MTKFKLVLLKSSFLDVWHLYFSITQPSNSKHGLETLSYKKKKHKKTKQKQKQKKDPKWYNKTFYMKQSNTSIIKTNKSENKSTKFYLGFMLEKTLASSNHITNSLVYQNH